MTNVIYPTADFAGDEFHQKYGFNNIKSDFALTMVAAGNKMLDTGLAMNTLSKAVIDYDEAHNKPAADKFIDSYNTMMDMYNTVLQHSDHPVAKIVGSAGGFLGQPAVAIGGGGLSTFIGKASVGMMANLAGSRIAQIGLRTALTATEAGIVTVPEAISHAYLAQTTPIRDNYNYMDALREIGQNFMWGGLIHLGIAEPIKAGFEAFKPPKKDYVSPVQVATSESMRDAAGKVEQQLMNEEEPNARAELHQGFNDQRNSGTDPKIEEVQKSADDTRKMIDETDSKIKELQEKAKEPIEPQKALSAIDIANRVARIETKPEEMRTDLEKNLLETLPQNETVDRLKTLLQKHELEIDEENDNFLRKQQRKRTFDIIKERQKIADKMKDFKNAKDYLKTTGIVPQWGTRNIFLEKNPLFKKLWEMKKTKKYDEDVLRDAEKWEMQQVLKNKPVYFYDSPAILKYTEIENFAKNHPDLILKKIDENQAVIAQNEEALNKFLQAKNQRELGLALGYKDIGIFGKGKVRAANKEFENFFNRAKENPRTAVLYHDENLFKQIDALEDHRDNLMDSLESHQAALDVLQQPVTAVDPRESETKPMHYSETDPVSNAEKITPEEEDSGIPEGAGIKESDFSDEGKEKLDAIREEKKELPNYNKLVQSIVDCITNIFYQG